MNFFEAQDRTRRRTRWLVLLFAVATLAIVTAVTLIVAVVAAQLKTGFAFAVFQREWLLHNLPLVGASALATAGFIGLASAYRTARLSAGGGRVAQDLGGTPVAADAEDPLRRRLMNVVEEMAIASGVPVPEVYVLEDEAGINAFAAGFTSADAAIAVTRGALELLDRDELQGVVAHEFSHVLNGDMRLNIRLMGVLFGILAIGLLGRMMLRSGRYVRLGRSRDNRGAAAVLAIGVALFVVGSIGVFMARLIKAGVSRQREYLADASAVQFTRQTAGIAGALKKIAGYETGSRLAATNAEEVSHMLFANGVRMLGPLLATHPPLEKRIAALDPSFRRGDVPRTAAPPVAYDAGAGNGAARLAPVPPPEPGPLDPAAVAASMGNPGTEHVDYAARLRASLPELLAAAVHSRDQAFLLALALALTDEGAARDRQLAILGRQLGELRARRVAALAGEADRLGAHYRLPLLELAFPALKDRPPGQLEYLTGLIEDLVRLDGEIRLHEYTYLRTLFALLDEALQPARAGRPARRVSRQSRRRAAARLLAILARLGQREPQAARAAYAAGLAVLRGEDDRDAAGERAPPPELPADWTQALDAALDALRGLSGRRRQRLVEAMVAVIAHDERATLTEIELLRAVCATLECPLPPFATAG